MKSKQLLGDWIHENRHSQVKIAAAIKRSKSQVNRMKLTHCVSIDADKVTLDLVPRPHTFKLSDII